MNGEPVLFNLGRPEHPATDDETTTETTEDHEPETDVHLPASADGRAL